MRPLPNSDEFHPTEWSPAVPPPVRRSATGAEAPARSRKETTETHVALVRCPLAGQGDWRILGIETVIG